MICATLKEAKAKLNKLVEQAVSGEDVVLMKGSRHVAAIVRISEDDLELVPRLSNIQATHLWEQIDTEITGGAARRLDRAEDLLK